MNADAIKQRIYSIDLLRGIVMMIMLLDHTRDFVHTGGFDPTDVTQTSVPLFFTRWITHYCAPTFVFLSGVSIYLQKMQGKTNGELSRFLWTRGLWLIFLEFTVIRFAMTFNFDYSSFIGMAQVIWVIGVSMIVMAALIYSPLRIVGLFGLAMIFLHNLTDGIAVPPEIAFGGTPAPDLWQTLWMIIHQSGGVYGIFFAYPLVPWIGVMAAGYAFGVVFGWEPERRRRVLLIVGVASTVLFVVVRYINIYGDLFPWSSQPNPTFTVLSFLNTTKYPPSLAFLLMTLGPAMIFLFLTDRIDGNAAWQRICITFGRVPMFFYILQWFMAHGMGVLLTFLFGRNVGALQSPHMSGTGAPPEHGFSLWVVYAAWLAGLVLLYPLCLWWGNLKKRNKHWALSYL
ncbi:MAG: DUF1624 domain-containing protein [Acidobacteria bacterium]|nr:DUF1624 domain-containing protein [Acidobacteriota bacterium]